MSAEVEYYSIRGRQDKFEKSATVKPGNLETSEFFGPKARLVISCNIDGSSSMVTVLGNEEQYRKIRAKLLRDEKDREGVDLVLQGRVSVVRPQELSLTFVEEEPIKRIDIHFSSDEDRISEELPQELRPLALV